MIITIDRGESLSYEMEALTERFGTKLVAATAYNPQGNGEIERSHSNLLDALRKWCYKEPKEWDDWLSFAPLAKQPTVNRSAGFTPFELVHGRKYVDRLNRFNFEQLKLVHSVALFRTSLPVPVDK
jgi:hypothetical protein